MTSTDTVTDAPLEARSTFPARRLIPIAVIALLVLGYFGTRLWIARQPYEWSGTVEARTISVGSRAGGRIKEVLVKEGERVKAGQVLLILEPSDLLAQKLIAEGQLTQAAANLEKLERGSRPEEIEQARARAQSALAALQESHAGARREQIMAAEARLSAAEVTVNKAKLDGDRFHQLLKRGAASQADVDNTDAQLNASIAQRDALKQALDELKNGVRIEELKQAEARAKEAQASAKLVEAGARVEDIQAAKGQLDAAKGKLDQILVLIDELAVRAPKDAVVESLDLRPGDIVSPNATCAVLLEEDQLYVRIYVPETRIGLIHVGEEVPISVDSFPNRTFKGKVEHIASVGEYSPRNLQTADERADQVFATRVGIVEGHDQLRAGMASFITVPK
jgi:multidrug resistance efflux pump